MIQPGLAQRRSQVSWAVTVFVILAVVGVFFAKWQPYYLKSFVAAQQHSIGASVVSGTSAAAPSISFNAAWTYLVGYFKDIWLALSVGLVLGAGVQVLLPRDWLRRVLGGSGFGTSALAAAVAVPSMMCTCCSAPLAVGMRRAEVSPGAVLAYWVGNPVLNPATIIFMAFVLGWQWAVLRIVVGICLVALVAYLGGRSLSSANLPQPALEAYAGAGQSGGTLVAAFFRALGRLCVGLLPEYIVIVAVLGAARAWLFPAMSPAIGGSILLMIGLALAGTLFVIPTAGEVPILQTLLSYGLGAGSAGALMITLPAVSLPSLVMVGRALDARLLVRVALVVFAAGIVTGVLALLIHP